MNAFTMQPYFDILNRFFDKIYVITLQRAIDRHLHIQKELNGLRYQLFYGKDKLEFSIDDLKEKGIYNEALAKQHHRFTKPMSPGMIGCSWSHKLVYEDVVANNYHKVLILEDDVVIDASNIHLLPQVLQELPKDWELIYFGFALNEQAPKGNFLKKAFYHLLRAAGAFKLSHKTINNLYPQKLSAHVHKSGYHDCTHAYAITLSAAQKLKDLQEPISFFPDGLLAYACTNEIVKAYVLLPKLINQQSQVENKAPLSYVNN
jgi:glycosyl transferase, family 25